MLRLICSLSLCALLSGCQNPWKDFYQGMTLPADAPDNGLPDCVQTANFDDSIKEYMRNDFVPFGQSSFNAGNNVTVGDLQQFGGTIKADVILYGVGNRTTTQSAMALPQYNPGTQQTTYLNGYGSNGSSFYGTANTYSPGTYTTTVVPVTIVRQDYAAVYLKKNWQKRILGVQHELVTAEQARTVGSNSAIFINIVVRGTPAFHADIYEGDVIMEINGQKFSDGVAGFSAALERNQGKLTDFLIYRNGTKLTKQIKLGVEGRR